MAQKSKSVKAITNVIHQLLNMIAVGYVYVSYYMRLLYGSTDIMANSEEVVYDALQEVPGHLLKRVGPYIIEVVWTTWENDDIWEVSKRHPEVYFLCRDTLIQDDTWCEYDRDSDTRHYLKPKNGKGTKYGPYTFEGISTHNSKTYLHPFNNFKYNINVSEGSPIWKEAISVNTSHAISRITAVFFIDILKLRLTKNGLRYETSAGDTSLIFITNKKIVNINIIDPEVEEGEFPEVVFTVNFTHDIERAGSSTISVLFKIINAIDGLILPGQIVQFDGFGKHQTRMFKLLSKRPIAKGFDITMKDGEEEGDEPVFIITKH